MYLSELKISNFRKFGERKNNTPGLDIKFNSGLNLLVGENDSGKTAIIDAIKMVLFTQSYEYYRLEDEDFYICPNAFEEERAKELRIECIFRGFQSSEAKNFLEWIGIENDSEGNPSYYLRVFLIGRRENGRIYRDLKAGSDEQGTSLDGKARDLLRIVYLRPLRDAEFELSPRRNSRLSQILYFHNDFSDKENHPIREAVKEANEKIEVYFKEKKDPKTEEKEITKDEEETGETEAKENGTKIVSNINEYLSHFSSENNPLKSRISIADTNLKSILEQLSLNLSINKAGLGSDNLLFIASELLLLKREKYTGLKLTLIEEIEAHLHPQAQLRLIEYLQRESDTQESDEKVQLILTTHSPNLASKVKLENLIICKNGKVFNMGSKYTKLEKGDYLFLERFLDVTKANLFFAEGVILVEGDAENLLIPTIAKIIGLPLSKHGVSIINVGSTAFLRYSRIFQRSNPKELIDTRVAVITDCDARPNFYYTSDNKNKKIYKEQTKEKKDKEGQTEKEKDEEEQIVPDYSERVKIAITEKEAHYNELPVKAFISKDWTLEYAIALSDLKTEFYKAVLRGKKIENSNVLTLTEKKKAEVNTKVNSDFEKWKELKWDNEKIAFEIYNNTQLKEKISKSIVAQCFAEILNEYSDQKELKNKLINDHNFEYIIDAIKYATSGYLKQEASDD
ncbi:MAG TPA: AAA family ATPase [Methanosarcina sp.]|jgi:putative ATP-dependent endonuclease of OLD family|nr:AAA family ATPase [Methanosarcina sp.]